MANSNYQKTKTNPHTTTAHVNVIMHSISSVKNKKKSHSLKDGHKIYYTVFYTMARKINGNAGSVMALPLAC